MDQAAQMVDRFNRIDYGIQLDRVEAMADRFKPMVIVPELNSRERLSQELAERNLPVQPFTTTKANGTGLGLSITHRLTNALGGRIAITSRQPSGTKVELTFDR